MENSPLADESVDLIWLNIHGLDLNKKILTDFRRVLKSGGLVAIEELTRYKREEWENMLDRFKEYEVVQLPEGFKSGKSIFGIYEDLEEDGSYHGKMVEGWHIDSEEKMIDWVTSHKNSRGFEHILDYALFRKN